VNKSGAVYALKSKNKNFIVKCYHWTRSQNNCKWLFTNCISWVYYLRVKL